MLKWLVSPPAYQDEFGNTFEGDPSAPWLCYGKGGGGAPASTTTIQTSLPEYAEPYMTRLMGRAEGVSNRDYEAYPGQRIAEQTGLQTGAFQDLGGLGQQYQPFFDRASQTVGRAVQQAGDHGYTAQSYDPSRADPFFNQYLDRVLDAQQERLFQRMDEARAQREGRAAQAGAFGGSRAAIENMIGDREAMRQLNETEANLLAQGFDRAHELGLGAAQFDEGSMAREAQYNLAGSELLGRLGQTEAGLGTAGLGAALQDIQARLTGGAQERAIGQEQLDQAYRDFANQRDYERGQLNFLSGILHGVPITPTSETQTFQNPNQLSQLLGAGIGGLGLYRGLTG